MDNEYKTLLGRARLLHNTLLEQSRLDGMKLFDYLKGTGTDTVESLCQRAAREVGRQKLRELLEAQFPELRPLPTEPVAVEAPDEPLPLKVKPEAVAKRIEELAAQEGIRQLPPEVVRVAEKHGLPLRPAAPAMKGPGGQPLRVVTPADVEKKPAKRNRRPPLSTLHPPGPREEEWIPVMDAALLLGMSAGAIFRYMNEGWVDTQTKAGVRGKLVQPSAVRLRYELGMEAMRKGKTLSAPAPKAASPAAMPEATFKPDHAVTIEPPAVAEESPSLRHARHAERISGHVPAPGIEGMKMTEVWRFEHPVQGKMQGRVLSFPEEGRVKMIMSLPASFKGTTMTLSKSHLGNPNRIEP